MKTVIVIPARYASTRFPGKVLFPLLGKPILQWVWEKAAKANIADEIIIATENEKVMNFAIKINAKAVMTSEKCQSGSDRVWEVVKNKDYDIVVNLQADEPFIKSDTIRKAWLKIKEKNLFDITTVVSKISDIKDINNPNCVKVAIGNDGRAVYFSRLPIPYHHSLSKLSEKVPYFKHCGIYVYRKESLRKFVSLPQTKNEVLERLEQLRAIDNGFIIGTVLVKDQGPAIDVPADIKKAENYAQNIK
ncbi:MAG: 3-deoxy-manno-octulosonate cytidylyltransferase [Elusimicrobiota bacterium]